jgi:hypothetical protein
MRPKKKVPMHRRKTRTIQAHQSLQPPDPAEPDELGEPIMSISLILISYSLFLSSVASGIVL